ncbi:MAG TPA: hypothetical protein VGM54_10095 [Chthoniobacter sp.]|jgi:hypothetical protein
MNAQEVLIYTVRPDGTALWVPTAIARRLGLKPYDRLASQIYNGREIQRLLEARHEEQSKREGGR